MVQVGSFGDGETLGDNVTLTDYNNPALKAEIGPTSDLTVADGLTSGLGPIVLIVGTSPVRVKVGASPANNLKCLQIVIKNDMFMGYSSSVTTSTGIPVWKNQIIEFAVEPKNPTVFEVWLVASSANREAYVAEFV
jgi:hypothetical protein